MVNRAAEETKKNEERRKEIGGEEKRKECSKEGIGRWGRGKEKGEGIRKRKEKIK